MATLSQSCLNLLFIAAAMLAVIFSNSQAQDQSELSLGYYSKTCPTAESIVKTEMTCAVQNDPRNAAAILRLHFHDCFVQGCDGSVLLDDTYSLQGEKEASQNANSLIGFDIVDKIKNQLESECPGVVSCADLLAIAARDAVLLVGGPYWDVPVGRKDSTTASFSAADTDLPAVNHGLVTLISKFLAKGLSVTDMVALVGAHTIGKARCVSFRDRIYGDFETTSRIELTSEAYLSNLQSTCPRSGGDENTSPMDNITPTLFDNTFYHILLHGEGLLNSDQELYSSWLGFETASLVQKYALDPIAFFNQFAESMVKMGNITNPAGGEVRNNCRFVNS
ncbi:Class I peroxidase protein [Dioscorea alata]|uniref:Class I peroxidase protein n=1 Tax=Dioscorea alata TaxID=55571 RepID=A0ACB7WKB8_DIOAL|nr:Class I peroxidase protein [Dioscorea alata]